MELTKRIQFVRDMINDDCIVRVPNGSKELPAMGGRGYYTWQFYLRKALLHSVSLQVIGEDFWAKNQEQFIQTPFQLAGVESAAVPIITAIVMAGAQRGLLVNAFTIRKNRKEYGLRNMIEGAPNALPVCFIDDLTSPQHSAFWHGLNAISSAGLRLRPLGYVVVLKKKRGESRIIATSQGDITIQSLFDLSDFALTLEEYRSEKSKND